MRARNSIAVAARAFRLRRFVSARVVVAAMIGAVLAASPSRAPATNGTWNNATSGGLWSAGGNWASGIIANGTDGIADFSTLNITSTDTVHLDSARAIGQLKFGDTTPSNNWILDNNGFLSNTLTLGVTVGSPTITVNNGAATINLALAGTQGLTKSGAGLLLLDRFESFTGSVAVTAGTLALGDLGALGATTNAVSVTSGATLDLGGETIGANPLAITGIGVGGNGALINSNGGAAASFAGTLTISAPVTVGGAGDITLSGSVNSSTNVLTKIGNNTLTLSGSTDNNNLAVTVNAGTVVLAKTGGVHAIGQAALTVNGGIAQLAGVDQIYDLGTVAVLSGSFDANGHTENFAALNLQGNGIGNAGALVNSAAAFLKIIPTNNTTLTGNATIGVTQSSGGLQLDGTIGGNFALTKTGLGTFYTSAINTFSGGLTVAQGTVQTSIAMNNAGTNGVLGNNTSVTLGSSGQTGTLIVSASGTTNMPFTLAAGGTGAFQGSGANTNELSGAIGGAGAMLVNGGTLTLSGNNSFTGGVTIINGATLQIGNSGALNASAPNTVTFGAATTTETSAPALILGGFSVAISGLNAIADNSGFRPIVQNASSTAATLTVNIAGAVNDTFSGHVTDGIGGGALSLVKTGAGTLTLPVDYSYSGTTTISGGTLHLAGLDNINMITITGTAMVDNSILEIAFPVASTLATYNYDYHGNISGVGTLLKSGSGTLTLEGNNTYTGLTTISGGTLVMSGGTLASNVLNQATFVYNGGSFNGRLTNAGTATFNVPFTAGNGLENDSILTVAQSITLNGQGLNNTGTITIAGGSLTLGPSNNFNSGTFTLSGTVPFAPGQGILINSGTLNLNGGYLAGSSPGELLNAPGGIVIGSGTIQIPFANVSATLLVGSGTTNVTANFSNSGLVQLTAVNADLVGGTIGNTAIGTIQGLGIIGNSILNAGTVESMGGTLSLNGQLTNTTGGLLAVDAGSKMLVTQGMMVNASIINLTGGTFDNGGQPMINGVGGQISGWGIFRTGGAGLDNNGSVTLSGGLTTVSGPVTNENGKTITVAYNPAIFTGLVTNNGGGTFNILSTTVVFAGGSSGSFSGTFTNNAAAAFSQAGNGVLEVDGAPALGSASSLAVNDSSTLRFKATSGSAMIGTGVTATVNSNATLELAGSVSALGNETGRVNITNTSAAILGILVSGTHQVVGKIDGSGTTQVNAGSDLTADHIVQSALVIGGTAGSPALVTIATSDSVGNPLAGSGFGLASSLESSEPFGAGVPHSADLLRDGGASASGSTLDGSAFGGTSLGDSSPAVPEPTTVLLALLGFASLACLRRRKRT